MTNPRLCWKVKPNRIFGKKIFTNRQQKEQNLGIVKFKSCESKACEQTVSPIVYNSGLIWKYYIYPDITENITM